MIKKLKEESAFTLIEMMIILMVISAILLIAVPNMAKNNGVAQEKGCAATVDLLQAQVGAYQIENGTLPSSLDAIAPFVDKPEITVGQDVLCPDKETQILLEEGIIKTIKDGGRTGD